MLHKIVVNERDDFALCPGAAYPNGQQGSKIVYADGPPPNVVVELGDLHGNALKLLHTLIKFGFITFGENDEERKKNYDAFYQIYLNFYAIPADHELNQDAEDQAYVDVYKHIEENKEQFKADLAALPDLINQLKIKSDIGLLRLVGDVFGDRGGGDCLTSRLFAPLIEKLNFYGKDSNHDNELFRAMEIYERKKKIIEHKIALYEKERERITATLSANKKPENNKEIKKLNRKIGELDNQLEELKQSRFTGSLPLAQMRSAGVTQALVNLNVLNGDQEAKLIKAYQTKMQAIGYSMLTEDNMRLHTHALCDDRIIYDLVKFLNSTMDTLGIDHHIKYKDKDFQEVATTIEEINRVIAWFREKNLFHLLMIDSNWDKSGYDISRENNPVMFLIWSRQCSDVNMFEPEVAHLPKLQEDQSKKLKMSYSHGHTNYKFNREACKSLHEYQQEKSNYDTRLPILNELETEGRLINLDNNAGKGRINALIDEDNNGNPALPGSPVLCEKFIPLQIQLQEIANPLDKLEWGVQEKTLNAYHFKLMEHGQYPWVFNKKLTQELYEFYEMIEEYKNYDALYYQSLCELRDYIFSQLFKIMNQPIEDVTHIKLMVEEVKASAVYDIANLTTTYLKDLKKLKSSNDTKKDLMENSSEVPVSPASSSVEKSNNDVSSISNAIIPVPINNSKLFIDKNSKRFVSTFIKNVSAQEMLIHQRYEENCAQVFKTKPESVLAKKVAKVIKFGALIALGALGGAVLYGALFSWTGPGAIVAMLIGLVHGAIFASTVASLLLLNSTVAAGGVLHDSTESAERQKIQAKLGVIGYFKPRELNKAQKVDETSQQQVDKKDGQNFPAS